MVDDQEFEILYKELVLLLNDYERCPASLKESVYQDIDLLTSVMYDDIINNNRN